MIIISRVWPPWIGKERKRQTGMSGSNSIGRPDSGLVSKDERRRISHRRATHLAEALALSFLATVEGVIIFGT